MPTNFYDLHNRDGGPLMGPRPGDAVAPPPATALDRISGMRDEMVRYARRDLNPPPPCRPAFRDRRTSFCGRLAHQRRISAPRRKSPMTTCGQGPIRHRPAPTRAVSRQCSAIGYRVVG